MCRCGFGFQIQHASNSLMVGTFGRLLAPILVACHTANHYSMSKKQVVMEQVDEVINEVNCDKINE